MGVNSSSNVPPVPHVFVPIFPNAVIRNRSPNNVESSQVFNKGGVLSLRLTSCSYLRPYSTVKKMDIDFHPGVNGGKPWVDFYPYTPSATAGYAFMAMFGVATVVHIVLAIPFRAAYFIPLILGGVCANYHCFIYRESRG